MPQTNSKNTGTRIANSMTAAPASCAVNRLRYKSKHNILTATCQPVGITIAANPLIRIELFQTGSNNIDYMVFSMRMNAYRADHLATCCSSMAEKRHLLGLAISRRRCNHFPEWESLTMVFHEILTLQDSAPGRRLVAEGL